MAVHMGGERERPLMTCVHDGRNLFDSDHVISHLNTGN